MRKVIFQCLLVHIQYPKDMYHQTFAIQVSAMNYRSPIIVENACYLSASMSTTYGACQFCSTMLIDRRLTSLTASAVNNNGASFCKQTLSSILMPIPLKCLGHRLSLSTYMPLSIINMNGQSLKSNSRLNSDALASF